MWLNLVGGCCGSTPAHIKAIGDEAAKYKPRKLPDDMLSISQPQIIQNIYRQYLEAGSHMIGTNTFSSTTIAMAD